MRNATTAAECRLQDAVFVPDTSFGEGEAWPTGSMSHAGSDPWDLNPRLDGL